MSGNEYKLGYTAGALMLHESTLAVEAFLETGSWDDARSLLVEENRLQMRMASSAKRVVREVVNRLKVLSEKQISFFRTASHNDKIALLWFALCKHYKFIADFAIEVVREKYLKLDYLLSREDYEKFFNDKAEWHPELERLTDRTQQELRQNLFRIMREAEIIDSYNTILSAILSKEFIELIKADKSGTLAVFPVPENLL